MDQALLVDQQIDDGQKFVDLLIREGFDVSAAAWIKPSEDDRWLLYLVSKVVDDRGLSAAYRAVHPMLARLQARWISLADLKLVAPTDPVAADFRKSIGNTSPLPYSGPQPTAGRRVH
jgi:hypothetical protein